MTHTEPHRHRSGMAFFDLLRAALVVLGLMSLAHAQPPTPLQTTVERQFEDCEAIFEDILRSTTLPGAERERLQQLRNDLATRKVSAQWAAALGLDEMVGSAAIVAPDRQRVELAANMLAIAHALAAGELGLDTTETNRGPVVPFLEGTDVFWSLQKGGDRRLAFPFKLEADIFPHLVAMQTFTDLISIDSQRKRGVNGLKELSYSVTATPAVRVRMLRQESAPVRTPSFMPRGNVQVLWARGLKQSVQEENKVRAATNPPWRQ